jgi:hypothetical protein
MFIDPIEHSSSKQKLECAAHRKAFRRAMLGFLASTGVDRKYAQLATQTLFNCANAIGRLTGIRAIHRNEERQ